MSQAMIPTEVVAVDMATEPPEARTVPELQFFGGVTDMPDAVV